MDYSKLKPIEAAKYAQGVNAFPKEFIDNWEVKSMSSGNDDKIANAIQEWRSQGFTVKVKSYSEFTSITGVKKKEVTNG